MHPSTKKRKLQHLISDLQIHASCTFHKIGCASEKQIFEQVQICFFSRLALSLPKIPNAMARPIKETPIVTGKDAKRFAEKMANPKPESKEERDAAKKVYEKFKAIASFAL